MEYTAIELVTEAWICGCIGNLELQMMKDDIAEYEFENQAENAWLRQAEYDAEAHIHEEIMY